MKRPGHAGPVAGLSLLLGACVGPAQAPVPEPATAEPPVETIIEQLPPGHLLDPVLADAGQRSGLPRAELRTELSRRVTWNDGSLGCPQPGMMYTQALVPGWHVIIAAGESTLDYRLADSGDFLLCRQGAGPIGEQPRGEPTPGRSP